MVRSLKKPEDLLGELVSGGSFGEPFTSEDVEVLVLFTKAEE